MDVDRIKDQYPLHYAVFTNNIEELQELLRDECELEAKDPVGNTPLQLCALLSHTRAAELLLEKGANADVEDSEGWSIIQECVSAGNVSLAQKTLDEREYARANERAALIPELLNKLSNAPDFYAEMKWDFTSWVPLVARMCPSDTYKIYKSGPAVRIDSTLTGYDQSTWKRGNVTFMFLANESGCELHEIDHERETVTVEHININSTSSLISHSISSRLSSPSLSTQIKTDNIEFWREKAGLIGFRTDRTEEVSGYECAVYSTSGVEIVTRERVEHLSADQRAVIASNTSMFESLLSGSVVSSANGGYMPVVVDETEGGQGLHGGAADYFLNCNVDTIRNRPKEQTDKVQKFKARVWLSQDHPLSLQEQLLPIVELMSTSNSHFAKLKDFITLQLPAGFPVNIEIPLYHMVNARITFSNINSAASPVDGVLCMSGSEDSRASSTCLVDAHVFTTPPGYYRIGRNESNRQQPHTITEDQMLQYAIQQSLNPNIGADDNEDGITWMEALTEQQQQQHVTQSTESRATDTRAQDSPVEDDFARAMRLSLEEEEAHQEEIRRREEEDIARILALSLEEK